MNREPNDMIRPIPADLEPVPAEVKQASDKLVEARERWSGLYAEKSETAERIREAQAEDVSATRAAVAAGKATPKPKAQAAVVRSEQIDRELEAARSLLIEAEDRYLAACRKHRSAGWLDDLASAIDESRDRQREALANLREAIVRRQTLTQYVSEIEQLGDESQIAHVGKLNGYAIFDLRPASLDHQVERELESQRRSAALRRHYPVTSSDPAAVLAAMLLTVEQDAAA